MQLNLATQKVIKLWLKVYKSWLKVIKFEFCLTGPWWLAD